MLDFLRWLLRIKPPAQIEAEIHNDKHVQRGEESIRIGERALAELEAMERRKVNRGPR